MANSTHSGNRSAGTTTAQKPENQSSNGDGSINKTMISKSVYQVLSEYLDAQHQAPESIQRDLNIAEAEFAEELAKRFVKARKASGTERFKGLGDFNKKCIDLDKKIADNPVAKMLQLVKTGGFSKEELAELDGVLKSMTGKD